MKLKDKVILVTASARGIGHACVQACANEGATVYMSDIDSERGQAAAEQLCSAGGRVKFIHTDGTKPEAITSMVDEVANDAGHIDVLINNFAAASPQKDLDFVNTDPKVFLDTVTLNLQSVFVASQAAVRYMRKGSGGSIINISSVAGLVPDISQIAYGTSKAAINHLTKMIAVHEAKNGIRCNAILPGMTATDAVEQYLTEEFRSLFLRHVPLGRICLPAEIAAAAVYFSSDDSAFTTGQLMTISGGFGLATPLYSDLSSK